MCITLLGARKIIRFKLILLVPLGIAFIKYPCFKSDFGYLERPRSTGSGSDLENAPCGYSVYHEDELR